MYLIPTVGPLIFAPLSCIYCCNFLMCFNVPNTSDPHCLSFPKVLVIFVGLSFHLWHNLAEFLEWHETNENLEESNLLTVWSVRSTVYLPIIFSSPSPFPEMNHNCLLSRLSLWRPVGTLGSKARPSEMFLTAGMNTAQGALLGSRKRPLRTHACACWVLVP